MSIILKSGVSGNLANVDALGNLQVLSSPAAIVQTATAWSSGTAQNTTQALLTTGGYPAIVLQLDQTSTITAGAITFEGTFDSINWVTIPVAQIIDPTSFVAQTNPYTLVASTNKAWVITVQGYQQVRYRLSTAIAGTGTITPYWTLESIHPISSSGSVSIIGAIPAGSNVIGHVIVDTAPSTVVTQGTSPWVVSLASTTVTGTVAVTQSTSPWVVAGNVASAASDSGNPVKIGGVFNTTQPTVTTGQRVDTQSTARGALIVSPGIDNFAVQATLSAETTKVIGVTRTSDGSGNLLTSTGAALDVNLKTSSITLPVSLTSTTVTGTVAVTQSTSPWTVQGNSASGATKAGNPVQIGGVFNITQPTVTTGQSVEVQATARGALIVATSVDAFAVNATLSAETTKVIGVVRNSDGAGNLITSNSTTPAAHFALDSNITSILGTAPTTVGKLDVKGADGDVFVRQTTGTNLHVVLDSGSTTVVTGTLTVQGAKTNNNAVPGATNIGTLSALANAAAPTWVEGNQVSLSTDLSGNTRSITPDTVGVSGALGALNNHVDVALSGQTGAGMQLSAGTLIGTIVPQVSYDGGTTFVNALFYDPTTQAVVPSIVFAAANGATTRSILSGPGATNIRVNVSAYTSGTANAQLRATQSAVAATITSSIDGPKTTYRAILKAFAAVASATSPFFSLQGSATKTIRVTYVRFTGTASTGTVADVWAQKFSVLTGGTSAAVTVGVFDSADPAATAAPLSYSVVPTTATGIGGFIAADRYELVTAAVTVLPQISEWTFGNRPGARAIVLRGTAQFFGIGMSAIGTTPVIDMVVEWTEE